MTMIYLPISALFAYLEFLVSYCDCGYKKKK